MQDPSVSEFVGLKVKLSACDDGLPLEHPEVAMNQEFASLLGRMTLTLSGLRLCRGLALLRGWPRRCVLGLSPPHSQMMLDSFKQDAQNYEKMLESRAPYVKKTAERSVFRSIPVQQCWGVFQESGWAITGKLADWLRRKHYRMIGSQVIEDGFCREHLAEKTGRNSRMAADRTMGPGLAPSPMPKLLQRLFP